MYFGEGEVGWEGDAIKKKRDEQSKKEAETRGCCVSWESRVSSMAGTGGFTGRNRCLLSAPVGLLRNNRPVTLRKCGETACARAFVCVCETCFLCCARTRLANARAALPPHHQLSRSSNEQVDEISQARAFSR